jgi:hypothetical protein
MGIGDIIAEGIAAVYSGAAAINKAINPFDEPAKAASQFPNAPGTTGQTGGPSQGVLAPELESAMAATNWFREKAISQPLATALLVASKGSEKQYAGNPGFFFNSHNWGQAWTAAQHISPGQAFMLNPDQGQASLAEASPLQYYKPADAILPQGFNTLPQDQQNQMLKQAGMPAVGNQYIESLRRDSNTFKYGSGSLDFVAGWEIDPTVLLGKGIGHIRATQVEAPASFSDLLAHPFTGNSLNVIPKVAPMPTVGGKILSRLTGRPQDIGWSGQDINALVNNSTMAKAQQFLWQNKDNPQLINQLPIASKSAMGPRLGAIVSTLKSPDEVNLFMRVSMGDQAAKALLESQNAAAAARIETDTNRLSSLDLTVSGMGSNPMAMKLVTDRMAQIEAGVAADKGLVTRYKGILAHAGEMDNVKMGRMAFARAAATQEAQNAYAVGPAKGGFYRATITPGVGIAGPAKWLDAPNVSSGIIKSRIATNFFSTPVTLLRSFSNFTPHGFISLDDVTQDSINELRGFVARIPMISPQVRQNMINQYLKAADSGERLDVLQSVSKLAMGKIAVKNGMTPDFGEALYREAQKRKGAEIDKMRQYATGKLSMPGEENPVPIDAFHVDGTALSIHPNLVSRLINDHILPDLHTYDQVLNRHSGALQALHVKAGDAYDATLAGTEFLQQAWKFGTLFRLGYIPRVLGDDLGGQIARLGMASMALRAGYGVKNLATNAAMMLEKPYWQAAAATKRVGVDYANDELARLEPQIKQSQQLLEGDARLRANEFARAQKLHLAASDKMVALQADATTPTSRLNAMQKLLDKRQLALSQAQMRLTKTSPGKTIQLNDMLLQQGHLQRFRDLSQRAAEEADARQAKVIQGSQMKVMNGVPIPGAFNGERGQYFMKLLSQDESLRNVFNTNKQLIQGNIMRSFGNGAVPVRALDNPELHLTSWMHVLNAQMAQDTASRRVLGEITQGTSVEESAQNLLDWFKTAEGSIYRKRLGMPLVPVEEVANSIAHDAHEMAPLPEIAGQALTPEGVSQSFLGQAIPNPNNRPDAISPALGENMIAGLRYHRVLDRVMQHWFDTVATLPSERWSVHPLYNQLYEGHAQTIMASEAKQGVVHTVADAERIAETARRLALKDTRNLVFTIAHKSDAMSGMRIIAPFFAATLEGWQRWSRIIVDRPEVAGYATRFFNAPLSVGIIQDGNGNTVQPDGKAYDPTTNTWSMVPLSNRRIVARVPFGLANGLLSPFGLLTSASSKGNINLSQDSMNLVLSGDPWFNPGEGPIVTIPLNEFVKDKPTDALVARQIGALPFGVSTAPGGLAGRVVDQVLPRTIRDFLISYNTSDSRYQQVKLQIMQDAYYRHATTGTPMPSATDIANQVKDYWRFSAASAFLGPVAGQRPDPFAFYRNQYNNLLRTDPKTADQQFLSRYGESYFVFAQSISKNVSGAGATVNAVRLEQKYRDLIAQNPDLAALIIGPEGNGPFSPEAYSYELNTPVSPGSSEMMRTKMTAEQAMTDNQARLGWAKYTGVMNDLNAQLFSRGLKTFQDKGAEDLNSMKKAYTQMLQQPLLPDGTSNPYYNDAWSKAYTTYDKLKYDRLIPGLESLANGPLAQNPNRSDLRVLRDYLQQRQVIQQMLDQRKLGGGSNLLNSPANSDLLSTWTGAVQGFVEGDVNFGNLYHRYLSRDMGMDTAEATAIAAAAALAAGAPQPTNPQAGA